MVYYKFTDCEYPEYLTEVSPSIAVERLVMKYNPLTKELQNPDWKTFVVLCKFGPRLLDHYLKVMYGDSYNIVPEHVYDTLRVLERQKS